MPIGAGDAHTGSGRCSYGGRDMLIGEAGDARRGRKMLNGEREMLIRGAGDAHTGSGRFS